MSKKDSKQKALEDLDKENKQKWIGLSNVLIYLEKKGMEINDCQYGDGRTDFVKGKILEENLTKNLEEVCKQINKVMNSNISSENPKKAIQEIYDTFKSINMIKKACREEGDKRKKIKVLLPYEKMVIQNQCNCGKDHEKEELDHPKKLDLDELKRFDPSYFYVINIHRGKSMIYFYLFLIIFGILMYALMPVWPHWLREVIWWISYILLIFLVGLFTIRLIIFLFFYIFGYDIWIFPDLNDNKLGVLESFYRLITVEKESVKWYTIIIRIIIALVTGYIAYSFYKNPNSIEEAKTLLLDALKDFYSFGEDKFVNGWNTTAIQLKQKQRTMEEINDII